jgi:hypothetical protein
MKWDEISEQFRILRNKELLGYLVKGKVVVPVHNYVPLSENAFIA